INKPASEHDREGNRSKHRHLRCSPPGPSHTDARSHKVPINATVVRRRRFLRFVTAPLSLPLATNLYRKATRNVLVSTAWLLVRPLLLGVPLQSRVCR